MCAPTPSRSSASWLRSVGSFIACLLAVPASSSGERDGTLRRDARLPVDLVLARNLRRRPHAAPRAEAIRRLRRYSGLWTAYYLLKADPKLRVVIVEREIAGFGASGRNGGWCSAGLN